MLGAVHAELAPLGANSFLVSEALAAPAEQVPATVVDAVLARTRRLDVATRAALEQLAVVPSRVELPWPGSWSGS